MSLNCFKHRSSTAIGICKSCGKGLCQACAADTGVGLACRDSCEDTVRLIGRMISNNSRILKCADSQSRSHGMLGVVMGSLFLGFGWWLHSVGSTIAAMFLAAVGLAIALHGLTRLFARRLPGSDAQADSSGAPGD